MGLDMYAYVGKPGQHDDYWRGADWDPDTCTYTNEKVRKPRQLAQWRKHGDLHGWICQLWMSRNKDAAADDFNSVEFELTWDDINALEKDVRAGKLPHTEGFFFGSDNTEYYRDMDLEFCADAKADLFLGLRVFYNSSW